jgi:hypothetical protein
VHHGWALIDAVLSGKELQRGVAVGQRFAHALSAAVVSDACLVGGLHNS